MPPIRGKGKGAVEMMETDARGGPAGPSTEDGGSGPALNLPSKPTFAPLSAKEMSGNKVEFRKVPVPAHRYTPLKENWMAIYNPIFETMKLDIRMNLKVSLFIAASPPLCCFLSNFGRGPNGRGLSVYSWFQLQGSTINIPCGNGFFQCRLYFGTRASFYVR
jgi:hypothetical protein